MLRLLFSAAAAITLAQSPGPATPPIDQFITATREYAAMHRRIEHDIPPLPMNARPDAIQRYLRAMTDAVRVARAGARQGDFFTPAVGRELRSRISDALLEHGFTPVDVYAGRDVEALDPMTVTLRVNDTFPWLVGASMFPCVIEVLPPLPPELQYRIVGIDLVLIDVHASLVVDILPAAIVDLDEGR